ncbi:DHA1 family chloramphenicol resistance protein-like MFS transporter [Psychromicrobium silvestre]|uniref:DHA1 family chloramphenicol resistance protein-like MFS transporter n=1 Tax=Psychromicrobium silvestre TaxID=1645614 RepID=A0A7Y9S5J3_9MICC|nr:Cmx/CmrA family chloramphenicol efflux MFS transporter [Psychromicrobium silvestre]NYE94954.1 DHA1 family chloramphenicol resistance protein-like MFS transporter [Psychromicrobium silvestre]
MTASTRPRLPLAVFVIGLGIFCLGTSEFMIAGLLPDITQAFGVDIPQAGWLITIFAIGMLLGAPIMTLLTLKLPRKTTLLGAGLLFIVAHVLSATTDNFTVLMATRAVAALACATFWSVGAVVSVTLAGAGRTAQALAVTVGGLTVANIIGVPAGTWLGAQFGWQSAFWAVAALTALSVLAMILLVPHTARPSGGNTNTSMSSLVRAELSAFRQGRIWLALLTTMLFQAAVFCTFSYLAPLMIQVAGIPESAVAGVLLIFGLGSLLGVTIGGRYADRNPMLNVLLSLSTMALALLALLLTAGNPWGLIISTFFFGVTGFSIAAALNSRVFGFAGNAPTLAASVSTSAFNIGNALGPWLGGLVIGLGLGLRAPIWISITLAVLAVVVALISRQVEKRPLKSATPIPSTEGAIHESPIY